MLEAADLLALVGVTPKKVDNFLVGVLVIRSQLDFNGPRDLLNAFYIDDGWSKATVAAEDSLLLVGYQGCQREIIERIIDLGEATVRIVYVLSKSLRAFFSESEEFIDESVLVVASEHHNLLWVFELKGHQ